MLTTSSMADAIARFEQGQSILEHFLYEIAGCRPTWTTSNVIDDQVAAIREGVTGVEDTLDPSFIFYYDVVSGVAE
jgi:hypothetical protein